MAYERQIVTERPSVPDRPAVSEKQAARNNEVNRQNVAQDNENKTAEREGRRPRILRCPNHSEDFEATGENVNILKCPVQGCVHFIDKLDSELSPADLKARQDRRQKEGIARGLTPEQQKEKVAAEARGEAWVPKESYVSLSDQERNEQLAGEKIESQPLGRSKR